MRFGILGPLEVHDDHGRPVRIGHGKVALLLTALLCRSGEWVRVDELVDAVWQDHVAPASAYRNMRTYVWRLRSVLGQHGADKRIGARRGYYRVHVLPGELDVQLAHEAVALAEAASDRNEPETAVVALTEALALWRGRPALPPHGPTMQGSEELYWTVRERLAVAYAAAERPQEAVTVLRELCKDDPLREHVWALLIRTLHRAGRRGQALFAFQQARAVLEVELGAEPGVDLTQAYREVFVDAAEDSPAAPTLQGRNDLPRALPRLVGRDELMAEIERVADKSANAHALVALEGLPGVGKSALALHVGHKLADSYPDGQLYVDLRTHSPRGEMATADALRRLIPLAAERIDEASADLDQLASLWRAATSDRRMLLILDDVADADQVRHLTPGASDALVIVTSRSGLTGLDPSLNLVVEPLPADSALEVFAGTESRRSFAGDAAAASEVVHLCGYLPAALRVAGERLNRRPDRTVADLAALLAEESGRRIELAEVVDRVLTSYRRLPPGHRILFRRLCLAPHSRIAADHAAALADFARDHAEDLLDDLLERHLLTCDASGLYGLPGLVADAARQVMLAEDAPGEISAARARLAQLAPRVA